MADEAVVEKQIDKVEAVRAGLNKARTLMLLHMVRKLTPEQRAKFNPVHEQWRRDNPRPPMGDNAVSPPARPIRRSSKSARICISISITRLPAWTAGILP